MFSLLFSKLSSALDDGAVSDDVCVSDDLTSDECSFSVFSSNALSEDFSGSFAAVSYTHLDVYKRQYKLCLPLHE